MHCNSAGWSVARAGSRALLEGRKEGEDPSEFEDGHHPSNVENILHSPSHVLEISNGLRGRRRRRRRRRGRGITCCLLPSPRDSRSSRSSPRIFTREHLENSPFLCASFLWKRKGEGKTRRQWEREEEEEERGVFLIDDLMDTVAAADVP